MFAPHSSFFTKLCCCCTALAQKSEFKANSDLTVEVRPVQEFYSRRNPVRFLTLPWQIFPHFVKKLVLLKDRADAFFTLTANWDWFAHSFLSTCIACIDSFACAERILRHGWNVKPVCINVHFVPKEKEEEGSAEQMWRRSEQYKGAGSGEEVKLQWWWCNDV